MSEQSNECYSPVSEETTLEKFIHIALGDRCITIPFISLEVGSQLSLEHEVLDKKVAIVIKVTKERK